MYTEVVGFEPVMFTMKECAWYLNDNHFEIVRQEQLSLERLIGKRDQVHRERSQHFVAKHVFR